jgi:hypothetical protein
VDSLEDMRRFMTEHMDFTRLQSNVTKHVNLMSELSETVTRRNLMEVSEVCAASQPLAGVETTLACCPVACPQATPAALRTCAKLPSRAMTVSGIQWIADSYIVPCCTSYIVPCCTLAAPLRHCCINCIGSTRSLCCTSSFFQLSFVVP